MVDFFLPLRKTLSSRCDVLSRFLLRFSGMSCLLPLDECRRQPIETLVESVSGGGATRLDVPLTVRWTEAVQSQLVRHFRRAHRVRQILLVRGNQEHGVAQFVLPM